MKTKTKRQKRSSTWVANTYTVPLLCDRNSDISKQWYVYFYYRNPDTGIARKQPFQFKAGINKFYSVPERTAAGEALARYLKKKLEKGWNPENDSYREEAPEQVKDLSFMYLIEALEFAKSKLKLAKKTASAYGLVIREMERAILHSEYKHLFIKDIKRSHMKELLELMQKMHGSSDKKINNQLSFLKSMFNELLEWEVVPYSVLDKMKKKRVAEQVPFKQPETYEKPAIKDYLEMKDPNFLTFVLSIYHTGARPKEILQLKVKDVNLITRMIYFHPDNTKSLKTKKIPIPDELHNRLQAMNLERFDKEYYVFGSPYNSGEGMRGRKRPGFCPNPTATKRDTATKLWNKLVKKELGLDCDMYGMKHRGGNDKLNSNISLEAIQALYGHSTKEMTLRYAFEANEIFRQQIINQSPDF